MRTSRLLAGLGLGVAVAFSAQAAAPRPKKPIQFERMMGRWYEIARTRNNRQKDCFAAYADWNLVGGAGRAKVANHCRKGSPSGPLDVNNATAHLVDARTARIRMSFFMGAINQEYWILDRADDYSWSIMATPGGNYVWVFSRQRNLPAAGRNALLGRVRALGYNMSRVEVVQHHDS